MPSLPPERLDEIPFGKGVDNHRQLGLDGLLEGLHLPLRGTARQGQVEHQNAWTYVPEALPKGLQIRCFEYDFKVTAFLGRILFHADRQCLMQYRELDHRQGLEGEVE
jgi:hypothetical protein